MARIAPFFASETATGKKANVVAKVLFVWPQIGSLTFTSFTDFGVTFEGALESVFYHGPLNVELELTDKDIGSMSGGVSLRMNELSDANATYVVNGQKLVVSATLDGKPETLTLWRGENGTYLTLAGTMGQSLCLIPVAA